jgi:hypothetical protein
VLVGDVEEYGRSSDPRLRPAIWASTGWWVIVRYGQRGHTRATPLDEDTLAAISAWVKVRPTAATDHLLLSLPRTGQPPRPLGLTRHRADRRRYAPAAGLPEARHLRVHADYQKTACGGFEGGGACHPTVGGRIRG